MNEITKNIDGYRLSTFINVDIDKKIKMGPIWDFNLAFGNADYCDAANTQGWLYNFNSICPGDIWQVPFWWRRLMESVYFKEGKLDLNKEMVLFCAGGLRSALAAKSLKDMGFEKVSHIDGGFGAIKQSKFKIV